VTRAGAKAVGELSGAISALALNPNLSQRWSSCILEAYFIEKPVSRHSMNDRHELPNTGIRNSGCPITRRFVINRIFSSTVNQPSNVLHCLPGAPDDPTLRTTPLNASGGTFVIPVSTPKFRASRLTANAFVSGGAPTRTATSWPRSSGSRDEGLHRKIWNE
jgi:hypothetical protein